MDNINFLRIPMMMLEGMADIERFDGLSAENLAALPREYTPDEISNIVDALSFAAHNPGFDFRSLMPDVPFSSEQIHAFLVKIYRSLAPDS